MKKILIAVALMFTMISCMPIPVAAGTIQGAFLEATTPLDGNIIDNASTYNNWNIKGGVKYDVIKTDFGTLGGALTGACDPCSTIDAVAVGGEVYVKPFNIPYLEIGVRHDAQTFDNFDISEGNVAVIRLGTTF